MLLYDLVIKLIVKQQVWYYESQHLAVLHVSNVTLLAEFLTSSGGGLEVGSGVKIGVSRANLISQLPKYADDETHKPGRCVVITRDVVTYYAGLLNP